MNLEATSSSAGRLDWLAQGLEDTDRLGHALGELLPDGTTLALSGTLGAGKTRLVQAIAAAHGIPREAVVSPTFVLCQEYEGPRMLYHLDAYRLDNLQEFFNLGVEEYFESSGLTMIEWADRVQEGLPAERLEIDIEVLEGDQRRFRILGIGDRLAETVRQLAARLGSPQG